MEDIFNVEQNLAHELGRHEALVQHLHAQLLDRGISNPEAEALVKHGVYALHYLCPVHRLPRERLPAQAVFIHLVGSDRIVRVVMGVHGPGIAAPTGVRELDDTERARPLIHRQVCCLVHKDFEQRRRAVVEPAGFVGGTLLQIVKDGCSLSRLRGQLRLLLQVRNSEALSVLKHFSLSSLSRRESSSSSTGKESLHQGKSVKPCADSLMFFSCSRRGSGVGGRGRGVWKGFRGEEMRRVLG
jgi:hypothetical protein